jgi:hypothetical protein
MAALAALSADGATAATYPVSGLWTYADAGAAGPAETCRNPTMEFLGDYRRDNSGGVPDYRNVTVVRTGQSSYDLTDLFLTAPNVRGHVSYTLQLIDDDHIQIYIPMGGRTLHLRRCAAR